MKKILILLISCFMLSSSVFAASATKNPMLKNAISKYKQGNYTGCLQTLQEVLDKDPSDTLAHYYFAITMVKLDKSEIAKKEYEKVIQLNTSSQLTDYAKTGLTCIDAPNDCAKAKALLINPSVTPNTVPNTTNATPGALPAVPSPPKPNDVKNFMEQKKLDNIKERINSGHDIDGRKSEKPTNDEIVNAMEVLKKAGLNGFSNPSSNLNPEAMQMNMLMSSMGGMNNNSMGGNNAMNMLPLLMMQQQNGNGNTKIDPKIIQSMMMSSMMPDMSTFDSNNSQY